PAIARLAGHRDSWVQRVADSLLAAGLAHATPATAVDLPPTAAATWPHSAFTWVWPMLVVAEPAADERTAEQHYASLATARRTAGTVSSLTVALANLAVTEVSLGRWPDAIGNATEGLRLATETGQHATAAAFLAILAWLATHQGRADDGRRLAGQALATAVPGGLVAVAADAAWTLAQLDLAGGQPQAALDRLRALATPGHPTAHAPIALLATGELVEAAAHVGALAAVAPRVARFERWAAWDRRAWTQVTAHRCRALLTPGDAAEQHYQAALAVDGLGELPFALARTELLYGEWLRRSRRRAGARPHLRAALELFGRLGATPWAERARSELRASGETARARDPSTRSQLTPQERQVARLADEGLSNQQIAAQLFLSPHTVSYHLHNVYTKLGITSRVHLRQLDLDGDADR
ncbi:MAG TPA: LuxR C-terminal-related transcriptional regulator, partial [Actinomycetota bacterium]|nr:LuxR C-terminal-related transcriptional regulator [Actinomycetota bacterium]